MNALYSMMAGAGLMYLLDPDRGRTRRAQLRDKYVAFSNDLSEAVDVLSTDVSNRMDGLRAGDMTVLVGGKNALQNPLRGGWSPTGRAILSGLGSGLVLYGVACRTPKACLLGTAGLAMVAEGITNAGIDDIRELPQKFSGDQPRNEELSRKDSKVPDRETEITIPEGPREFQL